MSHQPPRHRCGEQASKDLQDFCPMLKLDRRSYITIYCWKVPLRSEIVEKFVLFSPPFVKPVIKFHRVVQRNIFDSKTSPVDVSDWSLETFQV